MTRAGDGGSGPARRAVLRWAWRLFRREWRQQLFVLALATAAVAGAVTLASAGWNADGGVEREFGAGAGLARVEVDSPEALATATDAAHRRFGDVQAITHLRAAIPGVPQPVDVRAQDPEGDLGRPMLALLDGRYPTSADEVALTDGMASLLDAPVGAKVDLAGRARRVVGRVENPSDLRDDFALLALSPETPADSVTFLLATVRRDGPVDAPREGGREVDFVQVGGTANKAAVAAGVLAVTTLAMALVALVAAAGFLVIAQRRQRQLGLLAALGATPRHQRLVLLANGALVGVVAAILGAVLGIAGWLAVAPAVEEAAARRIDPLDVPWGLIGACMALAVAASTAAAWWPARTMSRQPVMAALSRRPVAAMPVHRSAAVAVAFLACGLAAVTWSRPTGSTEDFRPPFLMGGLVAFVVGTILLAPIAIRAVGRPARRLPLPGRLALRDLVRYQARASAALAAITLGLGISVAVSVAAKTNEHRRDEGNLSDRQLLVQPGDPVPGTAGLGLALADGPRIDETAARVAEALGGDVTKLPLDVVVSAGGGEPVAAARPLDDGYRFLGPAYLGTDEVLRAVGLDPTRVRADADLLTSIEGEVVLLNPAERPDPDGLAKVDHVPIGAYTSAPRALVTEAAVARNGWASRRAGWLLESDGPLTPDEVRRARDAVAPTGLTIEVRDAQDDLGKLRTQATLVGAVLALAIVAMAVGLLRGESAGDLRTLTATGAPARTRRAITANTAGALALLGALLGTAGAYLALVATYRSDLERLTSPPVAPLLVVILGIPVAAAIAGWALAGREPHGFARAASE